MDYEMFVLAFAMFWKMTLGVRCYFCDPVVLSVNTPLCQYFDGSDRYIVDCPHSTVCLKKKTLLLGLGDPEKSTSTTRGCARQLQAGYQEKVNGHWQHMEKIHDHKAYTDGCHDNSDEIDSPTKTTFCYCKGDLCNISGRTTGGLVLITLSLVVLI